MTEPASRDVAMRWLARNVSWSLRFREHRSVDRGACVLVQFSPIDGYAPNRNRRDRVA